MDLHDHVTIINRITHTKKQRLLNLCFFCFQPFPVRFRKTAERGAVNIQHSLHFPAGKDRNNNLRVGSAVTGNVARKGMHILHKLRFLFGCRRTAHTFSERDFNAGRFALERSEHKPAIFHQIKARPVDVFQRLPEQCGGIGEIGNFVRYTVD